ncbi:type I polyketide synthase [Sorangium cellulosum]|uniref:Uncharacterized protein n=1 Tax=Sorangium cellulosum So0157-2 TaxID=1254432 RepID=S4Y1D7_SORCE|nr:type I polyketide synthase [Sorangium cellulosum]AGP38559.1 hypothetical protein SCE1572_31230 [Sorangium cellulosum So0157-2]
MGYEDVGDNVDAVAIVAMSGRFSGARNVEELWQKLRAGVECVVTFTEAEALAAGVSREVLANPSYVPRGAPLDGVELFDASFFGFSPREAESMDPQQRIFLEVAWEALERAGYDPDAHSGPIGVFAGSAPSGYHALAQSDPEILGALGHYQLTLNNDKDYLTTHASYKLNLRGPSVCVQTSCSTSLVAVVMACQSLLNHECDMALAGGVGIHAHQRRGYVYQENGISSPDGHCRAFDAAAKGTVGGSGIGIVVLKRLADALADGDHVHAVIRGAAINNDGSSKIGYTAPSVQGQAEVIGMAQALAGVEPDDISYIEAHGTGTPLGDPIEIAALTRVFRAKTARRQFCAIGSLKTNLGHLDAAAGVASLIKTVMALEHRELPPSLHFERPNPKLELESSPFYVNTRLTPWHAPRGPRRAGVSSFGIGGTNAHVVLEEAPPPPPSGPSRRWQILTLAARSEAGLARATADMIEHLDRHPGASIADVTYTSHVGRRAWPFRRAVVGESAADLRAALASEGSPRSISSCQEARERPVVFLFPGQGAQHLFMARELYEAEPIFRQSLDRCAELLRGPLGLDLRQILYPAEGQRDDAEQELGRTAIAQPALLAIELSLAKLWMAWGIVPQAMIGHSVGEFAAACLAGIFREEDALGLVAERGRLMQQMPPGAMLAVPLAEPELAPYLSDDISLAAINGPALSVVAGPIEAIDALAAELLDHGLSCRRLHTRHAFHSKMMAPVVDAFTRRVSAVERRPPSGHFLSTLTGGWISPEAATIPAYWARQLVEPVRFAQAVRQLLSESMWLWLELGPGQTLSPLVRQQARADGGQVVVASLPRAKDTGADHLAVIEALGRVWTAGGKVDWKGFHEGEARRRVLLPTYPFERQRYWASPRHTSAPPEASSKPLLAKNPNVADWFFLPSWRRSDPPVSLGPQAVTTGRSTWLVFIGDEGLGAALVEGLARRGHEVVAVVAGERFEQTGPQRYTIDPAAKGDVASLFARLEVEGRMPDRIVHAFCTSPADGARIEGGAALEIERRLGFDSLLLLAQVIAAQRHPKPLMLGVITTRAHSVIGTEVIEPLRALVLGPCRVIPQEMPHVSCRNIDVDLPGEGGRAEIAARLIADLERESPDAVVAYRGGRRWVESIELTDVGRRSAGAAPRLRQRGAYLITGGLGGIGLVAAELLAREAHARLILVGRTGLPARQGWDDWLAAHGAADATSRKIVRIRALEEAGAEVTIAAADVSDFDAMRSVIEEARTRFGRIDGVIHSAGIASGGVIQLRMPTAAWRVMAPKVGGTLVLDALLRDERPDFLLICSSLASLVGGATQIDYCAANAFLDAYAQSREGEEGCRVISVQWDTWSDVGMAVDFELPADLQEGRRETLKRGISSSEGAEVLGRILSAGLSGPLAICTSDLPAYKQSVTTRRSQHEQAPAARPLHSRPTTTGAYVAPETETERRIAVIWQDLLGLEQVGANDDFLQLGGHSLLATQVLSRVLLTLKVGISLPQFFDVPTVAGLSRLVDAARAEGAGPVAPEIGRVERDAYRIKPPAAEQAARTKP